MAEKSERPRPHGDPLVEEIDPVEQPPTKDPVARDRDDLGRNTDEPDRNDEDEDRRRVTDDQDAGQVTGTIER